MGFSARLRPHASPGGSAFVLLCLVCSKPAAQAQITNFTGAFTV